MRLKFARLPLTIMIPVLLAACSKKSEEGSGYDFGAPKVGTIVDGAVPSALKSTPVGFREKLERFLGITAAFASQLTCTSKNPSGDSTCDHADHFIEFVRDEVFQKISGVAATQYYRYWIDNLDAAMESTNNRMKQAGSTPACASQTPIAVNFTFNINNENVTVTQKLQCWEQQTAPGAATQNMAFGKDSENFYLVYRTNDNAVTSGSGERYVIARASADGTRAEVWFVGAGCQIGTCTSRSDFTVTAQRVIADKATGAFTFNSVEDDSVGSSMLFSDFYANSNGTNIYIEAAYGSGHAYHGTGMENGGSANCRLSSDLSAVSSSTCSTLGRGAGMPANFGLSAPMRNDDALKWQAGNTEKADFRTALLGIAELDYSALGIGKFQ